MKKIVLILLILTLHPLNVFCTITDCSVVGGSYNITGSGFGAKATPGPLAFDTFDGGSAGSQIAGNSMSGAGVWRNETYNTVPVYSSATRTTSGLCSSHSLSGSAGVNHAPLWCDFAETNQSTIYVSFWTKFTYVLGSDTSWQLKYWRLTDGTSDEDNHTYFQDLWWTDRTPGLMGYFEFFLNPSNPEWPNYSIEQGYSDVSLDYDKSSGGWHLYQFAIKQDSINGSCLIWINGQQIANETVMATFEDGEIVKSLTLGWYMGNNEGDGTAVLYFDDVYIDNSWQRVEIGDNAVFANCTHREIQPAITWSDTGITGTFNQGSFETGDTVYFFVIDENGVASDGYAITLGSEPAYNPPTVSAGPDQNVYTSTATIIGTATADLGVTISGVTCVGQTVTPDDGMWDEQEESWTCSVVDLVLGPNVLEFIATDSEGQTGSDSVTVTRTQPGYSTRGSGYTIKGCSLK